MSLLDTLEFDNRFTTELPADPVETNVPHQAPGASFSRVQPTPTAAPQVIAVADEVV